MLAMQTNVRSVRVLIPGFAGAADLASGAGGPAAKRAIERWAEVPHLMPIGSKWQVVIPPAPLYGPNAAPPSGGPSGSLYFEIELVAIT
jgi:hypothetical protein